MKGTNSSFYDILDSRNRSLLLQANADGVSTEMYEEDELRGTCLPTKEVFLLAASLNEILVKACEDTSNDLTTAIICDIGCGIGNGAELIARTLTVNEKLPHLHGIKIVGVEKIPEYAEIARGIFANITPNSDVICDDIRNSRQDVISNTVSFDDLGDREVSIVYCNEVFSDSMYQNLLEQELIAKAPISTFFIFPRGLKAAYNAGIRAYGNKVFQKISNNVTVID